MANLFYNSFVVEDALLAQLALLQAVNEQLWDIEDELRAHERLKRESKAARKLGPTGL